MGNEEVLFSSETATNVKGHEPSTFDTTWWSLARKHLIESEYNVTLSDKTPIEGIDSAYQAPNRAYNFRTYFMSDRMVITPRTSMENGWKCVLKPNGYGRGAEALSSARGAPSVYDNRVEFSYGAGMTEWYFNDQNGLEQGFTIVERILGGIESSFWIETALGGDVTAELKEKGRSVDFHDESGRIILRAGDLYAVDSLGKDIECRFWTSEDNLRFRIYVEDQEAVYPVFIDPTFTTATRTGINSGRRSVLQVM